MELRRTLKLPLDDLLVVVRDFLNDKVSRSGLDRCLRQHGVSRLADLHPRQPAPGHKAYELGYLHVDVKYLPQMTDEPRQPRRPQTNGMAERCNGRIADVLNTRWFHDAEDLASTCNRCARLYNQQFPQSVLQGKTPMHAMQQWYSIHPRRFGRRPHDQAEFDKCADSYLRMRCRNLNH